MSGQWISARGVVNNTLAETWKSELPPGRKLLSNQTARFSRKSKFTYDVLHKRLQELAFLTPGIRIHIKDERTEQSDEFYYEDGLIEFVRYLNRTENPLFEEIISI